MVSQWKQTKATVWKKCNVKNNSLRNKIPENPLSTFL